MEYELTRSPSDRALLLMRPSMGAAMRVKPRFSSARAALPLAASTAATLSAGLLTVTSGGGVGTRVGGALPHPARRRNRTGRHRRHRLRKDGGYTAAPTVIPGRGGDGLARRDGESNVSQGVGTASSPA